MFGIFAQGQYQCAGLFGRSGCFGGFRTGQGCAREAGDVGAMFAPQFLARHQWPDHPVQPEEERLAQRKSGGDIDPADREQIAELQFIRVRGGILV